MDTLIDLIFKGKISKLDMSFLKDILENCENFKFHFPEIQSSEKYEDIINIIRTNSYVDLTITTNKLVISSEIVNNVFINIGLNEEDFELLFFMDIKDLNQKENKKNIDLLRRWAIDFQAHFNFDLFVCRMDNGNNNEYYFDQDGLGPLIIE